MNSGWSGEAGRRFMAQPQALRPTHLPERFIVLAAVVAPRDLRQHLQSAAHKLLADRANHAALLQRAAWAQREATGGGAAGHLERAPCSGRPA